MECIYCNNKIEQIKRINKINKKEKIVIIENIPTIKCNTCKEEYYIPEVVGNIEKILKVIETYRVKDKVVKVDYIEIMKTLESIEL